MEREISGLQGEISHLEEENIQLKVDKQLFDLEKANFEVSFAVHNKFCTDHLLNTFCQYCLWNEGANHTSGCT